jgi:hypothetical protein
MSHSHDDHPKPVTRRQLLARGLIGSAAWSLLPFGSFFGARKSWAFAECNDAPATGGVPFMVFDLAGGAAMPANFLVGKAGGPTDYLTSYDTLGWNPRASGAHFDGFGLPMAAGGVSKMLVGLQQTASAEALANLRFSSICHFAQDDSGANQLSPITLMSKAGARGLFLPKGVGSEDSASGGNSNVILADATLKPLFVSKVDDLLGAVSFGRAFDGLATADVERMARGALNLSMAQVAAMPESEQQRLLADLTECGFKKNVEYTQGVQGLDPRNDQTMQGIYGINQGTAADDPNAIAAAITMNAIKGQSGPGVLAIGGCDYHTNSAADGDAKDLEIGQQIGRAVETAKQLGKPLFFQILTDGGVSADGGTRAWSSDSGIRCMTVLGYYRPEGAPTQTKIQVGAYTDGQGVDRSTFIGSDASKIAYAVFANYLNIQGRMGELADYLPDGVFTPAQLEQVLVFA